MGTDHDFRNSSLSLAMSSWVYGKRGGEEGGIQIKERCTLPIHRKGNAEQFWGLQRNMVESQKLHLSFGR